MLALLLVTVAFAGSTVAAPNLYVLDADLEHDVVLTDESVDAEVYIRNSKDGGARTFDVSANGTTVASKRVVMEANSRTNVSIPFSLAKPGRYEIFVENKKAGWLTVSRFFVDNVTEREDGRTTFLRGGDVPEDTNLTANLPAATNQSFALERVTMTSSGSPFNRTVETYSPADGAPFSVPGADGSTVIGAVDAGAVAGVETTSMRIAIDRDAIREKGLAPEEIVVYRLTNGTYVPLSTSQASTTEESVVYEASTDGGSQFVVGSLIPAFAVQSKKLSTGSATDGKRINLNVTVTNDGPVTGEYTAEMRVDSATVDERTVSVGPGESRTIALQHTITEQGDYEVLLGNRSVGSVVLTGDAKPTTTKPTAEPTTEPRTDSDEPDDEGSESTESALPQVTAVSTFELALGAGIVIVGGGLLLLLRR